MTIRPYHSNHEGAIIDFIQQERSAEGLLINPGALSHYGYALRDAIEAFPGGKMEVHLSNVYAREEFRQKLVTAAVMDGVVCGAGAGAGIWRRWTRWCRCCRSGPSRDAGRAAMSERLERVRAALAEAEIDALLIGSGHNRRYVSGFTGSNGWLLIGQDEARLATDFRYVEQAAAEAPEFEVVEIVGKLGAWWKDFSKPLGRVKLGFEATELSVAGHKALREANAELPAPQRPSLVQTIGVVERVRAHKDAGEVELLRRAAALTDESFAYARERIQPEWTERRTAWESRAVRADARGRRPGVRDDRGLGQVGRAAARAAAGCGGGRGQADHHRHGRADRRLLRGHDADVRDWRAGRSVRRDL